MDFSTLFSIIICYNNNAISNLLSCNDINARVLIIIHNYYPLQRQLPWKAVKRKRARPAPSFKRNFTSGHRYDIDFSARHGCFLLDGRLLVDHPWFDTSSMAYGCFADGAQVTAAEIGHTIGPSPMKINWDVMGFRCYQKWWSLLSKYPPRLVIRAVTQ